LTDDEQLAVEQYCDKVRNQKQQLTARQVSAIAQGVVMQTGAARLKEYGGVTVLCTSWSRRFLKRHGFEKFAATTDRTVPASLIAASGPPFYKNIRDTKAPMKLTFNIDEFFSLLDSNSGRWTWHRSSQKRTVALRDTKLGFTMSALTSADGALHAVQMIWQGKTDRSHAEEVIPHSRIIQCHNPESHFQSAVTWNEFMQRFFDIVKSVRGESRENACLIIDAAPQHALTEAMRKRCEEENVFLVAVPPLMTHCFQPADQYVIKTIKEKINCAFARYVMLVRAQSTTDETMFQMYTRCTTHLRKLKYELLRQSVDQTSPEVVRKSWEATGILRESFDVPTNRVLPYDTFRSQAEHVIIIPEIEADMEEDIDDDGVVIVSDSESSQSDEDPEPEQPLDLTNLLPKKIDLPNVPQEFLLVQRDTPKMKRHIKEEVRARKKIMKEWKAVFPQFVKDCKEKKPKATKKTRLEDDPRQPKLSFPSKTAPSTQS
jgi:hypothetical protein